MQSARRPQFVKLNTVYDGNEKSIAFWLTTQVCDVTRSSREEEIQRMLQFGR